MNSKQAKEFVKALDALVAEKGLDKGYIINTFFLCAHSSIGQSVWLRTKRFGIRIPMGAPLRYQKYTLMGIFFVLYLGVVNRLIVCYNMVVLTKSGLKIHSLLLIEWRRYGKENQKFN